MGGPVPPLTLRLRPKEDGLETMALVEHREACEGKKCERAAFEEFACHFCN